jgi:hypothetical protein
MSDDIKALVLPALQLLYEHGLPEAALGKFDELLAQDLPRETRCAVLAYRSMAHAQAERFEDELHDLEAALALSAPDTQRRYGIELGLAMNAAKRGDDEARARWTAQAETTLRSMPMPEPDSRD